MPKRHQPAYQRNIRGGKPALVLLAGVGLWLLGDGLYTLWTGQTSAHYLNKYGKVSELPF